MRLNRRTGCCRAWVAAEAIQISMQDEGGSCGSWDIKRILHLKNITGGRFNPQFPDSVQSSPTDDDRFLSSFSVNIRSYVVAEVAVSKF